ncbi:hypothetical protein L484_002247 [Morus notabilis]|uniref:Epidermal patterning factor-like protein n=1 Tax=Morus notabilis TaxID=981085 RepID=W9QKK7_9ROSA|nr:hypothetical protein L484_002247 [Morus notabilis]
MASSSAEKSHDKTKIAATLIFILFLALFFCSSSAAASSRLAKNNDDSGEDLKKMKMVLGSKPPRCVNKCKSCRPCMAALVISQRQKNGAKASPHDHDQTYYLLAWKCKCRDKFFQP